VTGVSTLNNIMVDAEGSRVTDDSTTSSAPIVPNISSNRLHIIIAGPRLCLFLSALDTTIVTTALIKISSDFGALEQAAWLITACLLTYNCTTPTPGFFIRLTV
jgi:hypothetical protein